MRKAQAEFIIIIAILLIGAAAIFYVATNPEIAIPGTGTVQSSVREGIKGFIQEAARESMKTISENGGFKDRLDPGTALAGFHVNYLSANLPDTEKNLQDLIAAYIEKNRGFLEKSLADYNITLGQPRTRVKLNSDHVLITVDMPARGGEVSITQPYDVRISTRLGEAADFAKRFVDFQSKERFFETAAFATFLLTPIKQNQHSVPVYVTHISCSQPYSRTHGQMAAEAGNAIKAMAANTYMPGKVPKATIGMRSSPKFAVPPLQGNTYEALDIRFHVPQDFSLETGSEGVSFHFDGTGRDRISLPAGNPDTGCVSDPASVNVLYDIRFPIIVAAKDPFTNNIFLFAVPVSMEDNLPGAADQTDSGNDRCSSRVQDIDLTVSSSGNPVSGADIMLEECLIGRTDDGGRLSAKAPYISGTLAISKPGYSGYSASVSPQQLASYKAEMTREVKVAVHFYEVSVKNDSAGSRYVIENRPEARTAAKGPVILKLDSSTASLSRNFAKPSGLYPIPEGTYKTAGAIFSADRGEERGMFFDTVTVTSDTTELYFYIPVPQEKVTAPQDTAARTKRIITYSDILKSCRPPLGPVLYQPYSGGGCAVDYAQLGA